MHHFICIVTWPFYSFSLLVTKYGHTDGCLPAMSTKHFWSHPLPPSHLDRGHGWSRTVLSHSSYVLCMCKSVHSLEVFLMPFHVFQHTSMRMNIKCWLSQLWQQTSWLGFPTKNTVKPFSQSLVSVIGLGIKIRLTKTSSQTEGSPLHTGTD